MSAREQRRALDVEIVTDAVVERYLAEPVGAGSTVKELVEHCRVADLNERRIRAALELAEVAVEREYRGNDSRNYPGSGLGQGGHFVNVYYPSRRELGRRLARVLGS